MVLAPQTRSPCWCCCLRPGAGDSSGSTQPSLTGGDGPDEGHQEEVDGVVPGRDDEHHPVGVLADEGRIQLRHLQKKGPTSVPFPKPLCPFSFCLPLFPPQVSPELLPYQVLVHMLVLHPVGQVVKGGVELVLAQEDLRELGFKGWLGTQSTVPIVTGTHPPHAAFKPRLWNSTEPSARAGDCGFGVKCSTGSPKGTKHRSAPPSNARAGVCKQEKTKQPGCGEDGVVVQAEVINGDGEQKIRSSMKCPQCRETSSTTAGGYPSGGYPSGAL